MPPSTLLYDVAGLRAIERAAIARLGDAGMLMQRAGEAGWRCVLEHWPEAQSLRVVCGPGNNGGDGYVLARHVHEAGREVRVIRLPAHAPRTPLAQAACAAYIEGGGSIEEFTGSVDGCALIVDALFGIGLDRAPEGDAAGLVDAINAHGAPVLSIDVPSGMSSDSGHAPGAVVRATRTLQCLARHAGLHTGSARELAGALQLATLDAPAEAFAAAKPVAELLAVADIARWLRPRGRNSHKGDHGHVLCVGGDDGSGGAIMLAAEAALRCGAGLVSVATRPAHVAALLARRPECMVTGVEDFEALDALLQRCSVVALGPGLGRGEWGRALFARVLRANKPLVLDADALNLLAESDDGDDAASTGLRDAVLTPHPGEAGRLLGSDAARVQADRFTAARKIARLHGTCVVLKGAGSIIDDGASLPRVIGAGNPGMATGGMGDVLTGVIAALRAQGLGAFDAASCGALLHAAAGDLAAEAAGERGLLPSDLFAPLRRLANPQT